MRWELLFRDLEAQLSIAERADLDAEVADRVRGERASLRMVDRLRPAVGAAVSVTAQGVGLVRGRLAEVGSEWLVLDEGGSRQVLIPLAAVLSVGGLSRWTAQPGSEGAVASRLGLGSALRGIARNRLPVQCLLLDASAVYGTVDAVGSDYFEVAEHAVGEVRRRGEVTGVRTVAFRGLAGLRSA